MIGRVAGAYVDRYLIDDELIARSGNAAGVAVFGFRDSKASIEDVQEFVDAFLVGRYNARRVLVELLADGGFTPIQVSPRYGIKALAKAS